MQHLLTQRQPEDQQDDLHYASVHFSKKHSDPLYSNIRPKDEEEDIVVYTAIRFKSGNTATR